MANKKIEVWSGYDCSGRWLLKIQKKREKLTLDEIIEAAKNYEQDFYALIIRAVDAEYEQYYDVEPKGDYIELYCATDFMEFKKE